MTCVCICVCVCVGGGGVAWFMLKSKDTIFKLEAIVRHCAEFKTGVPQFQSCQQPPPPPPLPFPLLFLVQSLHWLFYIYWTVAVQTNTEAVTGDGCFTGDLVNHILAFSRSGLSVFQCGRWSCRELRQLVDPQELPGDCTHSQQV